MGSARVCMGEIRATRELSKKNLKEKNEAGRENGKRRKLKDTDNEICHYELWKSSPLGIALGTRRVSENTCGVRRDTQDY